MDAKRRLGLRGGVGGKHADAARQTVQRQQSASTKPGHMQLRSLSSGKRSDKRGRSNFRLQRTDRQEGVSQDNNDMTSFYAIGLLRTQESGADNDGNTTIKMSLVFVDPFFGWVISRQYDSSEDNKSTHSQLIKLASWMWYPPDGSDNDSIDRLGLRDVCEVIVDIAAELQKTFRYDGQFVYVPLHVLRVIRNDGRVSYYLTSKRIGVDEDGRMRRDYRFVSNFHRHIGKVMGIQFDDDELLDGGDNGDNNDNGNDDE
ncbi:MAG: hypothetical protein QXU32_06860 [Nitrososphaerales archaeon]